MPPRNKQQQEGGGPPEDDSAPKRPAIVSEKDLKEFDEILRSDPGDGGWAGAQGEIDYRLVFTLCRILFLLANYKDCFYLIIIQ